VGLKLADAHEVRQELPSRRVKVAVADEEAQSPRWRVAIGATEHSVGEVARPERGRCAGARDEWLGALDHLRASARAPSAVTVGDKPPPLILVGTATHTPDDRARGSLASGLREGLAR